MNYRPIISFREIKPHERELMKNAEAILKEIGFKFKATSPFRDDREWELEFSDDFAKEIYIQFKDDSDEEHSPIVIIDDILTDDIGTVNGDQAYYTEEEIDPEDFEEFKEKFEEDIQSVFGELVDPTSMDKANSFYDMLKDVAIETERNLLLQQISDTSNLKDIKKRMTEILSLILVYINDEEIMEMVYKILKS